MIATIPKHTAFPKATKAVVWDLVNIKILVGAEIHLYTQDILYVDDVPNMPIAGIRHTEYPSDTVYTVHRVIRTLFTYYVYILNRPQYISEISTPVTAWLVGTQWVDIVS